MKICDICRRDLRAEIEERRIGEFDLCKYCMWRVYEVLNIWKETGVFERKPEQMIAMEVKQ